MYMNSLNANIKCYHKTVLQFVYSNKDIQTKINKQTNKTKLLLKDHESI